MENFMDIKTLADYEKAIQNRCIILVTATWCPDCVFIKPFIGEVAKENPEFTYYKIDRDEMLDLCKDMDVLGIPSFVAYRNGQEVGRYVDKLRKTQQQIQAFIDQIA